MARRWSLALTVVLYLAPGPAHAGPAFSCEPGSRPFIKVLSFSARRQIPIHIPSTEHRQGLLLCRDRRAISIEAANYPALSEPFAASFLEGRVQPHSWSEVSAAAQRARIGFFKSCRLDPTTSLLDAYDATVTWYGAGARTHTFRLSTTDASLPACSLEVEYELWFALHLLSLEGDLTAVR